MIRDANDIQIAGAAAVDGWPPLPETVVDRLAALLAPLKDQSVAKGGEPNVDSDAA